MWYHPGTRQTPIRSCMSDIPTYASLLTRLFSGSPVDREEVLAHLEANEADRTAAEAEVRARLRDSFPWLQLIAAEAVRRVYRDSAAAAEVVAGVITRHRDPAVIADAAGLVRQLGESAVPLLVLMVRHAPDVFAHRDHDFLRWAARVAVRSGPDGFAAWIEMLGTEADRVSLFVGFAEAAPSVGYDLADAECHLRPLLAAPRVLSPLSAAAGAALWRVTWRVNRDWLNALAASGFDDHRFAGLRELVFAVLVEHLGRRPDVAGSVRAALAGLPVESEVEGVARLARLGSRGWAVLLPMLQPTRAGEPFAMPDSIRDAIFRHAAERPVILPLVHHHAHGVIASAATDGSRDTLVPAAVRVLAAIGPAAGMAVPDLLALVVRNPAAGESVGPVLPRLAPGFPNTAAAVARALNRVRTSQYFGDRSLTGFAALCAALAEIDPDAGPRMVQQIALDPRVPDLVLMQPAWKDAPPDARARHAGIVADALGSALPEVRVRAADLLRHYANELPAVWPALVAVLAGADEKVALAVLPLFRNLAPVAETVTPELVSLFRERSPDYAARAVVALWRLGRMPDVGMDLRAAVESDPEGGWGWAVLRGVVGRVACENRLLADLTELFAVAPAAVAEKVAGLINAESPEEAAISRLVPRPGDPTAPAEVDWDGVYQIVSSEGLAGVLFFVALMCEYGSAGFRNQKIWMIKAYRELTGQGLYESKMGVERTLTELGRPGAPAGVRERVVRDFFHGRTELPPEAVKLLTHRLGWVRWAGLELADAWGLTPEQVRELTAELVWDASPRVRERALRMSRG